MKNVLLIAVLLVGFAGTVKATPITVDFTKITNNNPGTDISSQLGLTIYDATDAATATAANSWNLLTQLGSNQFLFVFTNNVGIASNLTEIYVDNGPLTTPASVNNSLSGTTDFNTTFGGMNPANLPGGNTIVPPFIADALLSVDSVNGNGNGIDASTDALGLIYTVSSGGLDTIQAALDDGSLRFGLHVRSIGGSSGQSDAFVNGGGGASPTAVPSVPEPSTIMLLGSGLLGLAFFARRRA